MNPIFLTYNEFVEEVQRQTGKGAYHALSLYRAFYRNGVSDFASVPEWSRYRREAMLLAERISLPKPPQTFTSGDGTIKFVTRLRDDRPIESVLIPEKNRTTLCVSSQLGCAMGCTFCATGKGGFIRNLEVDEIVGQVFSARFHLNHPVNNLVFMGMGEPLENLDNLAKAMRVVSDQRGFGISYSHMTVSTAGHVAGLPRLAEMDFPRLRIAVSLNAANDTLRSALMPINRKYPLADLKAALRSYPLGKREVIFIEYVLLRGVNDSTQDATDLIAFLAGLPVRVNIIPFNACASLPYSAPTAEEVNQFRSHLTKSGLFVRVRQPHGTGIAAACGQLAGSSSMDRIR